MTIEQLPFPKREGIANCKDFTLTSPLLVSSNGQSWHVPIGTVVKIWTTANFGWICLPVEKPAPWGQRLFRQ